MGLFDIRNLLHNIGGNFMAIWNAITHIYTYVQNFIAHISTLFTRIQHLVESVEEEVNAIKNFEMNPLWRTRVISVPRAYEKINRLATQIPGEITRAIKDLVQQLKEKINAGAPPEDFNPEAIENDLKLLPEKLAKCGEKILGFVTLITDAVTTISSAVDDLQTIVDDFREIREDIQNLDAIFLPKGRPRKYVDIHYRKRNAM